MTWFGWFLVACYGLTLLHGKDDMSRWLAAVGSVLDKSGARNDGDDRG